MLVLARACISLNELLFHILLCQLEQTNEQLEFWTERSDNLVNYYIEKGPFEWIYESIMSFFKMFSMKQHKKKRKKKYPIQVSSVHQLEEIKSKIISLEREIAAHLGRLRRMNAAFSTIELKDLESHISKCIQNNIYFIEAITKIPTKQGSFEECCDSIIKYQDFVTKKLKETSPPNILRRNWLKITIFGIGISIGGYFLYKHRNECNQWIRTTMNSLKEFTIDHVVKPAKNILNIVIKHHTMSIFNPVELQTSKESLKVMLEDIGKDLNKNMSEEDLKILEEKAKNFETSIFSKQLENEIRKPLKSLITGNLLRMLLIQSHRLKLDVLRIMEELDTILKQNQINFDIMATIPVIIFLGGMTYYVRNIYKQYGITTKAYSNIVKHLRDVERILNHSCARDHAVAIIGAEDEGYLLMRLLQIEHWIEKAKISPYARKIFSQDLQDLYSPEYSVQQKMKTIERMYRTPAYLPIFSVYT